MSEELESIRKALNLGLMADVPITISTYELSCLIKEIDIIYKQLEEDRRCIELTCVGNTELRGQLHKAEGHYIDLQKLNLKMSQKLEIAVKGIMETKIIIEHRELHWAMRLDKANNKLESTLAEIQKI